MSESCGAGRRGGPEGGDLVWYVSYGSNMRLSRLRHYLAGGCPPGGARTYPGCRDPRGPQRSAPVELDGEMYFALESQVWTGGRAFYDPDVPGTVWARAHLLATGQIPDLVAQEMYRDPGADADLDLTEVLGGGRTRFGPGRYETLVYVGELEGRPMLTFTAPWGMGDVAWNKPSALYLMQIASGLEEAGAWSARRIAAYLADRPGAAGHWAENEVASLMANPLMS
ncbi:histone deacetylase [Streptomyces sp. RB6PN25]|uniref:Histone deacetylase n=1 Tax=Streptomyces humicola TaxID=2953240 RepID=A0ABT1Q0T3_9ACTN|nr:histone deacetylase [Streptomyces humicola]MCQ4083550.1 histone deacetylase [Streptomyces humicola]